MDLIKRALLGDKKAQEELTEKYELLPCPFCSGKPLIEYDTIVPFEYVVYCGDCGAMTATSENGKVAIHEWNNRPQILTDEEMERLEKN